VSPDEQAVDSRHRVYFIACSFPPIGRGNSITNACVANHLARDFAVRVICMERGRGFLLSYQEDKSLEQDLEPSLDVQRVRPAHWWGLNEVLYAAGLLPCYFLNWAWSVWRRRGELLGGPGILFAVYPVFSDLVLAGALKRRYGYPLVVDFRDDFSAVMARGWRRFFRPLYQRMEGWVAGLADHVTVTTEMLRQDLMARHGLASGRVSVVYNVVPATGHAERIPSPEGRPRRIVYAGAISRIQRPEILLKAYACLAARCPGIQRELEVEVYGPESPYFRVSVRKHLCDGTRFGGFLPRARLLERLASADLGFLSLGDPVYAYATPTKLFEFIELGIPMVAVLPPGAARDLIERHQLGLVVDLGDVEGLAAVLEELSCQPAELARLRANVVGVRPQFRPEQQLDRWRDILADLSPKGDALEKEGIGI
jgi:glycosyltransferase involved in cell wall biosynthesis